MQCLGRPAAHGVSRVAPAALSELAHELPPFPLPAAAVPKLLPVLLLCTVCRHKIPRPTATQCLLPLPCADSPSGLPFPLLQAVQPGRRLLHQPGL